MSPALQSPLSWRTLFGLSLYRAALFILPIFLVAAIASGNAQSTFKLLHTFQGPDGNYPMGDLYRDSSGSLFGVTKLGGPQCADGGNSGCGTFFRITASGTFSVLHYFSGGADGEFPAAGVTPNANGGLFGTTAGGSCGGGVPAGACGSIFKLTKAGTFMVLHDLVGPTEGGTPMGPLTLDAQGNVYGTTTSNGPAVGSFGLGTVFKFTSAGKFTVLHTFSGQKSGDGSFAQGG